MSDDKPLTVKAAVAAIRQSHWPETADAITALAAIRSPEADLALLGLLDHRSTRVRSLALDHLQKRSQSLARIAARTLMGDNDVSVSCEAIEILKKTGTYLDRQRLVVALAHSDEWLVRAHAADALAYLSGKAVRDTLLQALQEDPEPIVRRDAAQALANGSPSEVIPILEAALGEEKAEQARVGILAALYTLNQRDRLPELLTLWHSSDHRVRYAVLNCVRDVVFEEDKGTVVAALEALLAVEESRGLQIDAAKALAELRGDAPD